MYNNFSRLVFLFYFRVFQPKTNHKSAFPEKRILSYIISVISLPKIFIASFSLFKKRKKLKRKLAEDNRVSLSVHRFSLISKIGIDKMPAVKGDGMRGLAVFISDIRNCKSKEAEVKRINKELANIRSKFKGDKTLDGYQKKKYVCKLLFIFLLGHDIDFGHMEAVNLLSSNKYSEKQIGYLFISVLVNWNSDLVKLIIQVKLVS